MNAKRFIIICLACLMLDSCSYFLFKAIGGKTFKEDQPPDSTLQKLEADSSRWLIDDYVNTIFVGAIYFTGAYFLFEAVTDGVAARDKKTINGKKGGKH